MKITDKCMCGALFEGTATGPSEAFRLHTTHTSWIEMHGECKEKEAGSATASGENEDYLRGYREGYHAAKMEDGR